MPRLYAFVGGVCMYVLALVLMHASIPAGVQREAVRIEGPEGRPCLGTVWEPSQPKAVILLGHGVTSNRGVMATLAKAFSRDGYIVVALDFWGHGRSWERFDWSSNRAQIAAWCAWAKKQFANLPLAYLGHSMGGFSGADAFAEAPDSLGVSAFVAMGALPRKFPPCRTLVAAGRFEELFSPAEARRSAEGKADVLISPFSDHTLEVWDPNLINGTINWVNAALGVQRRATFPALGFVLTVLATVLGCAAAFILAEQVTALWRRPAQPSPSTPMSTRRWSVNPYRAAGFLLGCRGYGQPPRSGSVARAIALGIVFSGVFIVLLSTILNGHMFTCRLDHPPRLVAWLVLIFVLAIPVLLASLALERLPLKSAGHRFGVAALTYAVPFLTLCAIMQLGIPGMAFLGMMLALYAFILVMLSLARALATRASNDYRTGATTVTITLAWLIAFWFPLFIA